MAYIGSRETFKNYQVNNIDIMQMSSGQIINEVINRIKFLCQMDILYLSYKDLSIIIDKSDRYISHLFNEYCQYNPDIETIIKFVQISQIPFEILFCSEKEKFEEFFAAEQTRKEHKDKVTNGIENLIKDIEKKRNRHNDKECTDRINRLQALLKRRRIKIAHYETGSELAWKFNRREIIKNI